ncbi:MAG: hypothetical protein QOD77_18 [Thermoplasmata archaeon]|nr:hypothetical protein [Thermoplasmata archaeon]
MDPPNRPEPGTAPPEAEGEVRLAREITLVDATMMGVGALMGGGVFVLLGLATAQAGPAVLLALFLNGFITIPTLLVYAELGSASDDAGGGYLWVKQGLGQPFGFLGGWLSWFSHVIACALYSIASAAFIVVLLGFAGWLPEGGIEELRPLALTIAALFIFLNFIGVKIGIKAENVINTVVLVAVLAFIGVGLWKVSQAPDLAQFNLSPFWPAGSSAVVNLSNVFLAMGITFIAFEGYEIISQTSEEIQDPRRNIPRAIWFSFLIAWGIMLLVTFIALAATYNPDPTLQSWHYLGDLHERALITAAGGILPYGAVLIAGCALLLQLTALNATIYSSSRVSFAMGRDGQLPRFFGRVHRKRRTPHTAVLGSGVLVLLMALLPIHHVAVSADVMFLLLFLLVNLSYIKLRKVIPQEKFGFKAPFFPYIPIIGIFTKFFLAIYLWKYSQVAWYVTGLWIALGLVFYYLWVRRREAAVPVPIVPLAAPLPMAPGRTRKAFRVVVLLSSPAPSTARALARTAATVAEALDGEVVLLQPVVVPELTPLTEGQRFYKDRSLLQQARAAVGSTVPATTVVRIGHNLDALVRETVREEGASLLLMSGQARATVGQPTSPLLAYPPCDVAVLRLKKPDVTAENVLVTAYSGPHAPLGIRLGTALARASKGKLLLYHATGPEENVEAAEARGQALLAQNAVPGSMTGLRTEPGPAVRKVLDQSRGHDLVVVGASAMPKWWRKGVLGPRTQEITDRVAGNVLIVRSGQGMGGPGGNWLGRRLMQVRRYFQAD